MPFVALTTAYAYFDAGLRAEPGAAADPSAPHTPAPVAEARG
jgi:hypothetical protein